MKKTNNYLSLILALTLLAGCGSSGSAAAPEESSSAVTSEVSEVVEEATPEPEETEAVEEPVYDFDSKSNYHEKIGDYQIEIPVTWTNDYPIISPGKNDTFRMVYLNSDLDPSLKLTEAELLGEQADAVISKLAEGFDEYEVLEKDTVTYSGINMLYVKISATFDGTPETIYNYAFLNPSDGKLLAIVFLEEDGGEVSLIGDIKAMLNTLEISDEEPEKETAAVTTVEFGDYTLDIPADWKNENNMYYPQDTAYCEFGLFNNSEVAGTLTEEMLFDSDLSKQMIDNMAATFTDPEIIYDGIVTSNDIDMLHAQVHGGIQKYEGVMYTFMLINPSDGNLLTITYFQDDTADQDHFPEVKEILKSIKLAS